MATNNKDFLTLIITMVIGGLTYSVVSFSYMHTTFSTKDIFNKQEKRIERVDVRIDKRLTAIDKKLDDLLRARK